jgi:hypothetical protein
MVHREMAARNDTSIGKVEVCTKGEKAMDLSKK